MRRNQNRKESVTASLFEALTTQFEMKYPMLCEMAKVYSDRKNNISIQVNRSERRNSCYFKLYNNKNYAGASKVARIDMKSPAYVYHFNGDGKGDWILNSEEKSMLVDLLSRELPTGNTLWQEIIIIFNREGDLPEWETRKNLVGNLMFPKHLPFDLPMPDYTKLHYDTKKANKVIEDEKSALW